MEFSTLEELWEINPSETRHFYPQEANFFAAVDRLSAVMERPIKGQNINGVLHLRTSNIVRNHRQASDIAQYGFDVYVRSSYRPEIASNDKYITRIDKAVWGYNITNNVYDVFESDLIRHLCHPEMVEEKVLIRHNPKIDVTAFILGMSIRTSPQDTEDEKRFKRDYNCGLLWVAEHNQVFKRLCDMDTTSDKCKSKIMFYQNNGHFYEIDGSGGKFTTFDLSEEQYLPDKPTLISAKQAIR